jgi:hypothetical protein
MSERAKLLKTVAALESRAVRYFEKVKQEVGEESPRRYVEGALFDALSEGLQREADILTREVVGLMHPALSLAQQSAGLTSADHHDLGIAIRQMRSALHLRRYRYSDTEVLHDEGTVLGVVPPRQFEREIKPSEAAEVFKEAVREVAEILELAAEDGGKSAAVGPSASADRRVYRPGTAFIMMSMDSRNRHLDDVCNTVKRCFADFRIEALRADDIEHEGLITERILEEIQTAEFLFADLTGERPSVYYELGFAHAIRRPVMLFREQGTTIHFDVQGYNCPEYENLSDLEKKLRSRLRSVTGRSERRKAAGDASPLARRLAARKRDLTA